MNNKRKKWNEWQDSQLRLSKSKTNSIFRESRRKYRKKAVIVILCVLLLFAGGATLTIKASSQELIVSEYEYRSEKISEPFSAVVLADLHDEEFGSRNIKLTEEIRNLNPDLILLAGDMINDDTADFKSLIQLCKDLQKIAPIYVSKGNQERDNPRYEELKNQFESEKISFLDKSWIDLKVKDNRIRIGGLYSYTFAPSADNEVDESKMSESSVSFLKEFESTDHLKLLIAHRPDSFLFSKTPDYWDIDMAICGHFHGGQIVLPVLGALWAPHMGFFPDYVKGEKVLGSLTMFTTSGLGSGSKWVPRINNPSEIMEIRLMPESSTDQAY